MTKQSSNNIEKMELWISQFLRYGVLSAGVFLIVGWLWGFLRSGDKIAELTTYEPQSLLEILHWAVIMNDRPVLISYFGLAILISLPVLRVLLTGIIFLWKKEYVLGLVAFIVLAILLASFSLGIEL